MLCAHGGSGNIVVPLNVARTGKMTSVKCARCPSSSHSTSNALSHAFSKISKACGRITSRSLTAASAYIPWSSKPSNSKAESISQHSWSSCSSQYPCRGMGTEEAPSRRLIVPLFLSARKPAIARTSPEQKQCRWPRRLEPRWYIARRPTTAVPQGCSTGRGGNRGNVANVASTSCKPKGEEVTEGRFPKAATETSAWSSAAEQEEKHA